MTILLLNQFFWPDSAATSQLLTDLARALAAEGHQVHVICGAGQYAGADLLNPPPVTIHRTPAMPFGRGAIARILSYGSFFSTALIRGFRIPRPDVVVTLTTPPLLSWIGTLLKLFRGARHFVWEMDVYPDIAVDLGYLRQNSLLTVMLGTIAGASRRHADGILVLGECMRQRLLGHGLPEERLHVVDNWFDGTLIQPQPHCTDEALTLLYSGNLGLAHDVETLQGTLFSLKNDHRFRFVFAGGGALRPALERWCAENAISNVRFYGYRNRAELGGSLGEGDIGLVTQKPESLGSVVPSKIYGIMAAGRPTLFIGPDQATPARIIRRFRCGWQVGCGQSDQLTTLLQALAEDREQIRQAGVCAREAFLAHYDLPHGVGRIKTVIGAVGSTSPLPVELTAESQP